MENRLPIWKIPSGQIRWMGIASCTDFGIVNFSFSAFAALLSVLLIGILPFLRDF